MWRDIALANRGALLASLDDFEAHLARLGAAIERSDGDALETVFRAAKKARDGFARDLAERGTDRTAPVSAAVGKV
jgi:prephenate dehydrogenase